jgi:glucokinase
MSRIRRTVEDGLVTLHLGLDLGGTNVKCAVVARAADGPPGAGEPRVVATDSCPTGAADGPDAVLARVASLGRAAVAPFGEPASAGLALPGHFDHELGSGVLLPNLLGDWVGRPIAGPVGERLGLPVTLVNDVRALTLAELRLGAGRGARDLVCVALGTGVGGGVVIDGRLHLGLGHAGEIGHTTVDPDGPPCGCGNRGCLDRMAGAGAIAEAAGQPTVAAAAEAARAGDEVARAAFARAGEYVGRVLAGAVVLLWPERIVVGGGVADAGELLLEPLRAELRRRACVAPVDRIGVVPAELGPHAGAVGAALWAAEVSSSGSASSARPRSGGSSAA